MAAGVATEVPSAGFVPYEEVPHTADRALRVRGRTLAELFVHAARGMYALMAEEGREEAPAAASPPAQPGAPVTREVALASPSPEGLLVAWLNELLYLTEREGTAFTDCTIEELAVPAAGEAPARLRARVGGRRAGRGVRKYLKAATYHNLSLSRRRGLYEAVVVFDV